MSTSIETIPFWDYSNTLGPNQWASLCPEFATAAAYQYQSPIAFNTANCLSGSALNSLIINYQEQLFTVDKFTQSIHLVPDTFSNSLQFDNKTYQLQDIHVHMPNEHVIDGVMQPLEIHFVHRNENQEILVMALFVKIGENGPKLPTISWTKDTKLSLNPASLLGPTTHFFNYSGSLTTPPTNGPVTWLLLKDIQTASATWLDSIRQELPCGDNNRPTQPLNGRHVHMY
ncbi:carbonic anhydrase family protein [Periweissella fabalis]|uniref:carbonic anhydrase n=1 Tax=Periweissella fabalis TaxID=1070421 RepID=A0A7X6N5J9_9LACO|nr:carbonic anhydrase family protein [Periweissella fabalis]MCM0598702.1 carbonic anhydrase family protein [Periweissella fabalis]NKZ24355.1 carbonic anhydrase family protein [Periweissella fabalis]